MKISCRERTAVRERPILLSGFWVKQLLAGNKSQTRRVARETGRGKYDCPYGKAGDYLWVRESWQIYHTDEFGVITDGWDRRVPLEEPELDFVLEYAADGGQGPWRPSIHMPRWASRLRLEVTSVRAEWLRDISELDARAEGIEARDWRAEWIRGWDAINARRGFAWATNPLVWVVSFRVVEHIVGRAGGVPLRCWPMH